jgi:hypothetical protein
MPVPDFSPGEVLTAAAMDSIGLWRVTTVSPTPATTIAVNNCFTSDYTNYLIIATPIGVASPSDITLRLRVGGTPSTVNYYMTNIFADGASLTSSSQNNIANWRALNIDSSNTSVINALRFELYGPALANSTRYHVIGAGWSGTNVRYRQAMGFHDPSVAYDGFDLTASSNITATISVYGYNKS